MTPALRLSGVHKSYGKVQALRGLELQVPRGVICGLVGPNGAGKTTTFGVVGGYVQPDSGSVDLLGQGPFDPRVHRGRVALLPQDCELNPHMAVAASLRFLGRLQGLSAAQAASETDRVLDLVDLRDRAQMRIRQLSHGMRRRVSVAQAFLGQPELVLLDEPTAGLDPDQVVRLRRLFLSQKGRCTLLISSHVLSELEQSCDHVIFMQQGRVVRAGPIAQVTGARSMVRIRVEGDPAAAARVLSPLNPQVDGDCIVLHGASEDTLAELNRRALSALLQAGIGVLELRAGQSLEAALLGP